MEDTSCAVTKSDLEALGFTGFTTILELRKNLPKSGELSQRGIYAVVCSPTYKPIFINPDKARENCNVIIPWSLEKLKKKWVPGVEVLYFGKAGTDKNQQSLRKRITKLIRHSQGKTTKQGPHKGGELLWQLKGCKGFEVGLYPTDKPDQEEDRLINLFFKKTGKIPFANRIPRPRRTRFT